MSRVARLRLLKLGRVSPLQLHAAYTGLAESMKSGDEAGWLVLARSRQGHIALGASQYADAELDLAACRAAGVPVIQRRLGGGTVWVDEHQLCVFFIVPEDGQRDVFFGQCLEVLRAALAKFGLTVDRVGEQDLWCAGAKLLGSGGATIGVAQVFGSSLLERFDAQSFAACVASPSVGFRDWLSELLAHGMTDLERLGVVIDEARLSETLLEACALQWPIEQGRLDEAARQAMAAAAEELNEPLDPGGRRQVRGGIKINRHSYLLEDSATPWLRLVWRDGALARAASGDAKIERVLAECLDQRLAPGVVAQAAERMALSRPAARELEARLLRLCRDAGR